MAVLLLQVVIGDLHELATISVIIPTAIISGIQDIKPSTVGNQRHDFYMYIDHSCGFYMLRTKDKLLVNFRLVQDYLRLSEITVECAGYNGTKSPVFMSAGQCWLCHTPVTEFDGFLAHSLCQKCCHMCFTEQTRKQFQSNRF